MQEKLEKVICKDCTNLIFYFPLQKFLDNCTKCGKIIENETIRPKESGKPYHADCFCCTKCGVSLQGKYFNVAGEMLCEDDFAVSEVLYLYRSGNFRRKPRCLQFPKKANQKCP